MKSRFLKVCLVLVMTGLYIAGYGQLKPYSPITGRVWGKANTHAPDPLVNYKWAKPKASDDLEHYTLRPVRIKMDGSAFDTTGFASGQSILVKGKGDIRFDYGRVSAGWLEFDSDDLQDTVQMSISEYNEPAIVNRGAQNRFKTKAPVRHGNTWRLELNKELYEGVRFGWIHVKSHTKNWHIVNPRLICQAKPVNYQGSFACSDTMLTRIWYTGAYTVRLNLLKDYFGAILMERSDRQSWTGDANPSQAAALCAFGNYDFIRHNLELTSGQNNGIASYSLYWVLSLVDYLHYTGDKAFAQQYLANACGKLDTAFKYYGTNPKLGFYGWDERLGAGFENPQISEAANAYKMLTIRAGIQFADVMENLGLTGAGKYKLLANQKLNITRQTKNWAGTYGIHAAADAINTGLTSARENAFFNSAEFANRLNRLSYSPFNQYFIIQAMARLKQYDDAIVTIKDNWGGQISYGGATFFEVYRPSWNTINKPNDAPPNNQAGYTSLTHPWGAGLVKWLSEETLGIKPLTPGFKTFSIMPHLGKSVTWVSGAMPTPHGNINASFNILTGQNSVTIPTGTMAESVGIPKGGRIISSITLNNRVLWDSKITSDAIRQDEDYIYFTALKPGTYKIKLKFTGGMTKQYIAKPLQYPVTPLQQDSTTAGNWKGKYGRDGYTLFNYGAMDINREHLPDYITSVTLKKNFNLHWESTGTDNRALIDPLNNTRNIGALTTQDPRATYQTFTIDVAAKANKTYQLALYFIDWENEGRRSAVELFNLNTLKILAPVQIIRNYGMGKYLMFKVTGPVRVRINHVRGSNAVISGLFFN